VGIRAKYREDFSKERGGQVFLVQDDDHPDLEGVLSFTLLSGGRVGLEAIEVVLAPLRSATGSFRTPIRASRRLAASEVASLPLGAWVKAAEPLALQRFDEVREQLEKVRAELKARPPKGKGALRRFNARKRLLEVSRDVLTGVPMEDIAERQGVVPSTARVMVHQARLRGLLPQIEEEDR
jgi:hypothetical protein